MAEGASALRQEAQRMAGMLSRLCLIRKQESWTLFLYIVTSFILDLFLRPVYPLAISRGRLGFLPLETE